ncbi:MAG: UDP-N-acetylmuramate--L-alanine ligase [Clostridia bacterium]|nr:UDP-N-acetylmuramate--L-alanine ligase [Clostridia bacterium]MBQ4542749.1 UDP-N-acetylmuramate--L-alanine ligase [Clostridia bacterium]
MLHKTVHFIGIGGVSMSALAHILLNNGVTVSGSDATKTDITDNLEKCGAKITIGHSADNIENPSLVVYTAAISNDNPELVCAQEKGIETMERADFLGKLMLSYKCPISVSGTHGKTTTTSMLSTVFLKAQLDPTILVGGEFPQIGSNYKIGSKNHLIFEGCEYVDSFLKFNPKGAIITNVDKDHLDYFKGIKQIRQSFNKFLKLIPDDGFAVVNADDKNTMKCLKGVKCKIIKYGKKGQWKAKNISYNDFGCGKFDVYNNKEFVTKVTLNVPGIHNIYNALAVFACANYFGISSETISQGLSEFVGAKRRFELKGYLNDAPVYDDYAHHPKEIITTIATAEKITTGKMWCIFQPHTYTRTYALLNDFAKVLSKGDNVIINKIYAARERNTVGISGKDLADKISGALYIEEFDDIANFLKANVKKDDIVITIGAGTITKLSDILVKEKEL